MSSGDAEPFTAAPVAAVGEGGEIFAVSAGPGRELPAVDPTGEVVTAARAASDGLLIARDINHVFAVADAPAGSVKQAAK